MSKKIIIPDFLNAKASELSATKKVNGDNTNYKLYLNGELIFDYDVLKSEDSSEEYYKGIQCSLIVNVVNDLLTKDIKVQKKPKVKQPKKPVQDPNVLHMTVELKRCETYYWINNDYSISCEKMTWNGDSIDLDRFNNHNCYTKENAEIAVSILKAKIELQNIATELNDGRLIDWENESQRRYNIYFINDDLGFEFLNSKNYRSSNIYCLDDSFLKVAIKKMGVDNLKLALEAWK